MKILQSEDQDPDLGPFGYQRSLVVYLCTPWTKESLTKAEATLAAGQALEDEMTRVVLTSNRDGTGFWIEQDILNEDATRFIVGAKVDLYYRKDKEIGFGKLVGLRPHPPEPSLEISM